MFEPIGVTTISSTWEATRCWPSQVSRGSSRALETRLTLRDLFEKPTICRTRRADSLRRSGRSGNQFATHPAGSARRGPAAVLQPRGVVADQQVPARPVALRHASDLPHERSTQRTGPGTDGQRIAAASRVVAHDVRRSGWRAGAGHRSLQSHELPLIDLSDLPLEEREEEVRRYARQESQRPVDLAQGPLARMEVVGCRRMSTWCWWDAPHSSTTAGRCGVASRAVVALRGLRGRFAIAAKRVADSVRRLRRLATRALEGAVYEDLRRYWLQQLEDLPPAGIAHRFSPAQGGAARVAGGIFAALSSELSQGLTELAQDQQATLFMR